MIRRTINDTFDFDGEHTPPQPQEEAESEAESSDDADVDAGSEADAGRVTRAKTGSIKIFVRVRPPRANDARLHMTPGRYYCSGDGGEDEAPKIGFRIPRDAEQGLINNQRENFDYRFNRVFDKDATQEEVFDHVAKDVVLSALEGYNGTIFAYGQTGSGKTFTITGGAERYTDRGLIPRTLQFIYKEAKSRVGHHYEIGVSYLEIYNETGYDLLDTTRDAKKLEDLPKVRLQEDESHTIHLQNLSNVTVTSEEEALNLLFVGDTNRMIAETPSNPASSRSHCIFIITIVGKRTGDDRMWKSKLHLVDLAGSERTSRTGITGNLFKEASYINLSLHYLEQVIVALHEKHLGKRTHIPYRNSMMTSLLRDSLGGNCMTTLIATVAPEDELIEESISTCRFAQRVALVSNRAQVNEEVDPQKIIARLKREVTRLKAELRIARGETGEEGDDLPDYEKDRVKLAVDDYVADSSSDAALIFSDARKIAEAYRIMKAYILERRQSGEAAAHSHATSQILPQPNTYEISSQEAEKLKTLVAHRDNEINVLIGMINKYKAQVGESKLLELKEVDIMTQPSATSSRISHLKPSAPKPNLAASIPRLTADKAKLFENFKLEYPGTTWIDEQKCALKLKYAEAKKLGEQANTFRMNIKHIKDKLAEPDDGSNQSLAEKQDLRESIAEKVFKYKCAYQNLKEMKLEIDHMEHLLEQARIRLSRAFEQWYEEVHLATCKISPSASPAPPMHTEDSSSRESDFGRVSAIISSNSASSVAPTSLTLENNQRPRSALDERVSNIRKAHTAFISNSASPYSSTSTLFLNDPSPRPSASPSVEMMDRKPPPVASLSLAGGAGWTSQAPRLSCPGRSMSSLSYSVTTLQNQSPRVHSASSSRPLTPAISSTLRPLKGVGEGMIDKSVESDIAAFYEAREGLLRSKGVPKNTSSFIGRLFDKQQQ